MPSPLGIVASSKSNAVASGAVRFSAANQRYTRAAFGIGATDITIACWAKIVVNRATYSFPVAVDNGASNYLQLGPGNTGVNLGASGSTGGVGTSYNMVVGTWTYIALVWTVAASGDIVYYVAAPGTVLTASGVAGVTGFNAASALWVGGDGFSNFINGSVAALKIWTAALTKAELEAELPKRAAQRTSGLYASYELNGPSLVDSSGNGRTLTAGAGTPALDAAGPPIT